VIVFGIDPGSQRCGYGVVVRAGGKFSRVASGVIEPGRLPIVERLAHIFDGLSALLAQQEVHAVAIETAFCGRSPRSALALGQARGVALAAAARAGVPVFEYAPAEVKRAFTGNGRAEKAQMMHIARTLFGLEARLADEADALAVAVCCLAGRSGVASLTSGRAPARKRGPAPRSVLRPAVHRFSETAP
jgi:crossover junction endodeoxyribonuclease RuvC